MAPHPSDRALSKAEWRSSLIDQRRAMSDAARREAADAITLHVESMPLIAGAKRVGCYVSMPSEPGTDDLIATLLGRGIDVVVPRVEPDAMAWVSLTPDASFSTASLGMREPQGDATSLDGVAVMIVPALAVDHRGTRLGRGAGHYDRALAGVTVPRCALVFAHELVAQLPSEPHDIPVDLAVSPHGLFRIDRG